VATLAQRTRLCLAPGALALLTLVGCGSAEETPAPAKPPAAAPAPAHRLLDSYAGTWTGDDGVVYGVEDAAGVVRGTLVTDPSGRWRSVEFTLRREENALRGVATVVVAEPEASLDVRWELLPAAGGELSGRVQTAWLDESGEVVLFAQDPEWRDHRFDVEAPAPPAPEPVVETPPAEPEPEPVVETPPAEPEPVVETPAEPEADAAARAAAEAARREEEERQTELALAAVDAEETRLDQELDAARERWAADRAARAEAGRARREERTRREAEQAASAQPAPSETTPAETTPAETTPAETTPAETTPAETTPTETTPAETAPAEPAGESAEEVARREEAERARREAQERAAEEQARRERERAEAAAAEQARREEEERKRQEALAHGGPDPEQARELAEEQARRDAEEQRRREEIAAIRERRRTPEGLAQVIFEALKAPKGGGELFTACFLDAQDTQHLFGARGSEHTQLVRSARTSAWFAYRRESVLAELQRATFVRADVPVRSGRKGPEVQNGTLVYRVDGAEKTIPLAQLFQVEDGSWKAYRMQP
jgi:hypothetical protein